MTTLVRLEVLRVLRNGRYLFFTLAYPVVLYLIFGNQHGAKNVGSVPFKAYYMVSMAGFGAIGAALNVSAARIAEERKAGWTRQLRLTSLGGGSYVAAKLAAAAVVTAPCILVVLAMGGLVNGVHLAAWQWVATALALWAGSFVFAVLGIALGYVARPDTAQPVMMLVYLGMSVLGGMWMPITAFPSVLQKIGHAMPTYRFGQLGWSMLGGGGVHVMDLAVLVAYLAAFAWLAAWRYRKDEAAGR